MYPTDLSNCDREPIHIPGKIQSHGFLLAVNRDFNITYCSENIMAFAPVTAQALLGTPIEYLEMVLLDKMDGFVKKLISVTLINVGFRPHNPYPVHVAGKDFNLLICAAGDQFLLEFEPGASDLNIDIQQLIGSTLSEIMGDANLAALLDNTAHQVQKIIGYDRVMVYKFHEDGHGEVVAEAKMEDIESWLGLHYPASDIPQQARALYKLNLVRLIADVGTIPSAILTYKELAAVPLDLTDSALRAVSPMHIQYLQNMGVASSFSVSLIHHGELWGLIACHHYSPRFINYKQREVAKLIGQVLSSSLSFRQLEVDQQKTGRLHAAVDDLTRHLLRYNNIEDALFNHDTTLLEAVEAGGAVLAYDNHFYHIGQTPDDAFLGDLLPWLQETMQESIYATNRLPEEYPFALAEKAIASGMLVCRLSQELKEYLIWFRPEVLATVTWAGNPDKSIETAEDGTTAISPRKSFQTWYQQVESTSAPWQSEDFRSALRLREEVAFAISRKATEIRLLNEKLREAYDELDAFSYTISHDLKNPLTTIKSYSQLLQRNLHLQPREQRMLEGILFGAVRMQNMIDEVLHYSKAGQIKVKPRFVDMKVLLSELKEQLLVAHEHLPLTIDIGDTLPIYGDETMIRQVFANLMGNAVKYSGKTSQPQVGVHSERQENQVRYRVTDNGIGIRLKDRDKIFDLFSRSDDVDDYEGSGVGLAIVKKIMEKHKGRIWVESEPGTGSTFHVAFHTLDLTLNTAGDVLV